MINILNNKFTKLSLITSLLLTSVLYGEDNLTENLTTKSEVEQSSIEDEGEFEDEFGEDEVIAVVKTTKEDKKQKFIYYGSVTASGEYSYINPSHISSNKYSSNLKLEYTFNDNLKMKSTINAYKAYETNISNDEDIDINELTLETTFKNGIDAKIGRQIVVWGKSDNIRITDTLNPMDMTTPGMVDIKDLRLGRGMSKFDYFVDKWSFSGILLHENRFSKMPESSSEYYMKKFPNEPSNSTKDTGIAFSANGNLEGEDISFYYSNQYIDNTTYKSNMLGFAYNKVIDSFLYKTEIAYFDNYDSSTLTNRTDSLIGVEYNGIEEGSISLEIANKDNIIQYAVRFTQSYINQTVDFTVLFSGYGKEIEDGGFTRIWLDYDYNDDVALSFGIIDYLGGDNQYFEKIKDNDRLFTSLKYSF